MLHFGALAHAPLSLVQAFTAGGLVLTVPVAARAFGQRLQRTELLALGALVAALSLLGLGAGPPVARAVPVHALAVAVVIAALAAGALALARTGGRSAGVWGRKLS